MLSRIALPVYMICCILSRRTAYSPASGASSPLSSHRYQIAQRLPGRTDHAIRNRYHRLQARMHGQHLP